MLKASNTPLKAMPLLAAGTGVVAAIAAYCLAYAALAGRPESPLEAIAWAVVNVLPWLAAFEIPKRLPVPAGKAALLAAAFAVSLRLQWLLIGWSEGPEFELVRRVPGLLVTGALIAAASLNRR